eukprot:TRINITY_DN31829_c0_g1_i1.p1 TRINITY_DN31829_c0_g1~~TRINITY_DN31829_c0_g1_i1.p1  ORF type:complete len:284 (-),score=51.56 TRINITY_DN31829_c0_g1_i1:264-1115(-)
MASTMTSNTKAKLMLPDGAVPGAWAAPSVGPAQQRTPVPYPAASPQPIVTPIHVHSTEWRTQQCPSAPLRKDTKRGSVSLPTPATLWPSPAASPPVASPPALAGDRFAWATGGAVAHAAMPSPGGSDMQTPNNIHMTTWRRIECPNAPMRHNLARKQSTDLTPFASAWAATTPAGASMRVANLDRFWPSPGATPANSVLNTAFIGTPISAGAASPSFFGMPTPIATMSGEATPSFFGLVSQLPSSKTEPDLDVEMDASSSSSDQGSPSPNKAGVPEWLGRLGA